MLKKPMNRKERRALKREQHQFVKQLALSENLSEILPDELPSAFHNANNPPLKVWRSRKYLVQLFSESNENISDLVRLSVCRTKLGNDGRWQDGLTWDELQGIKKEVGFGDWYGVEIYPPEKHIVNVANMRHLWLTQRQLSIGWGR